MVPRKKNGQRLVTALASLAAALVVILLGLWPLALLATPGILIYCLCRLIALEKRPASAVPAASPVPPASPAPASEQSALTVAFGVLQKRVTEAVHTSYPAARWTWLQGNARELFSRGEPLRIMLNGAGGFRCAEVRVQNLQFSGLIYQTLSQPAGSPVEPKGGEKPPEEDMDYGLLAFEWVAANLQQLNAQCSESASQGRPAFRIAAEELPHGDSWPEICAELVRNGFSAASVLADGIEVQITKETERE